MLGRDRGQLHAKRSPDCISIRPGVPSHANVGPRLQILIHLEIPQRGRDFWTRPRSRSRTRHHSLPALSGNLISPSQFDKRYCQDFSATSLTGKAGDLKFCRVPTILFHLHIPFPTRGHFTYLAALAYLNTNRHLLIQKIHSHVLRLADNCTSQSVVLFTFQPQIWALNLTSPHHLPEADLLTRHPTLPECVGLGYRQFSYCDIHNQAKSTCTDFSPPSGHPHPCTKQPTASCSIQLATSSF